MLASIAIAPGDRRIERRDMFKSYGTRLILLLVTGAIVIAAFAPVALAGGGHWGG